MKKQRLIIKRLSLFTAIACSISTNSFAGSLDFALGKALFDRPWNSAPSSTKATDGLGPLFNARSCLACHPKAGRGIINIQNDGHIGGLGYVIRLGSKDGQIDPVYGSQLQTNGVQGLKAEAQVFIQDGYYDLRNLSYGPLHFETNIGARLSQPLHGLGLLERISDEEIIKNADPDDKDKDGISGRVHWIYEKIGRFSWKATTTSLYEQAATAFSNDIGMSTPLFPDHYGDCTDAQTDCRQAPNGASPEFENVEIDSQMLNLVTTYLQGLKPPVSDISKDGLALFKEVGCAKCHVPTLSLENGQKVWAFSDLLLHDMGEALNDGIKEKNAAPSEWRTQPLWGTSKTKRFLHDGRATSVAEAIHFHDGEARLVKEKFQSLKQSDKRKLLDFVKRL